MHPSRQTLRHVALATAVAACAAAPGRMAPAPAGSPGTAPSATACLVADTTTSPTDTVRYVADGPHPAVGFTPLDCNGDPTSPSPPSTLPAIDSVPLPRGTDLRDVLDRGIPPGDSIPADLVFTRDADVLAYAARRPDFRSVPLPWDLTYALAVPAIDSSAPPDSGQRAELARDAVQSDARGAVGPFWWRGDTTCRGPSEGSAAGSSGIAPVVGYPARDVTARQLAERIVALAASPQRPTWIPPALAPDRTGPLRVMPIARDSMGDAMAAGRLAAAVVVYPRDSAAACVAARSVPDDWAAVPLIDSRPHVLVRRGSGVAFYVLPTNRIRILPGRRP